MTSLFLFIAALALIAVAVAGLVVLFKIDCRLSRLEIVMATVKDSLAKINEATNRQATALQNIAGDVRTLKEKLPDPADQVEAERLAAALDAQATFSEGLAASTEDPVPPVDPNA